MVRAAGRRIPCARVNIPPQRRDEVRESITTQYRRMRRQRLAEARAEVEAVKAEMQRQAKDYSAKLDRLAARLLLAEGAINVMSRDP